ncbi:MAG: hydantoinase/oxoprolinase family protein [Alphaproteobacteria bacterium]|nr:MAG: hydantoinase/oxoprolinase family protein [Alphaproteobacteria bacterium]
MTATPSDRLQIAGIDVGGTFTDLILVDPVAGRVRLAKTPTTANQADGVLAALDAAGVDAAALGLIVHGTTTTTNAVLQRRLARTGLITTRGFRDVLELGRRTRPRPYGMTGSFRPVIPRDLRREVTVRMDAEGRVLVALDEDGLRAEIAALLAAGCESLVIHFLHSYANPAHERRAGEIARAMWPNGHVTLGHELLSEAREFERGVTAAVNAAVQPLLERYLARLTEALARRGYPGELLVMNGNGGMVSARMVAREAAKTVMSGPASGVMAAAHVGRRAGFADLLTYDMGGTSTDVALIRGAQPAVSSEIEVEYAMPIHLPMVDVRTVGAGGGSIARVDASGLLRVGPDSAGADPGPICYGRGGTEPTITDANLLLGRLNPAGLTAVEGEAPIAAVRAAFARLGAPLGLEPEDAAAAVLRVANTVMAGAVRMVSLSLGADPRDFVLFAFGGAGPLHATQLARELGIPRVLVPARPGLTNALGCVVADLRHDFVTSVNQPLDRLDIDALHALIARHAEEGRRLIAAESVALAGLRETHALDMQFQGQTHLLRVPLDDPRPDRDMLQRLFESAYAARFRVELTEIRPVLVNVASSVVGMRPDIDLSLLMPRASPAPPASRRVRFGRDWIDTPVFRRESLPGRIEGPAVVEQMDTTILIEPGDLAETDGDGNLLITLAAGGAGAEAGR